jgi:hypothetical protein
MIDKICELLGISRRTYHNWNLKYDGYEHPKYQLLKLIHLLFQNEDEIDIYIKYNILSQIDITYNIYSKYDDINNDYRYYQYLAKLLGVKVKLITNSNQLKNVKAKLNKTMEKHNVLDIIKKVFNNNTRVINDFLMNVNMKPRIDSKKFNQLMFAINENQINILKTALDKCLYSNDIKMKIINSIFDINQEKSTLDRLNLMSLLNHINSIAINNDMLYRFLIEYKDNKCNFLLVDILSSNSICNEELQKYFLYFPEKKLDILSN